MTQSSFENQVAQLKQCLSSVRAGGTSHRGNSPHTEVNQDFEKLRDAIATENSQSAELLNLLWQELLSAHRSVVFWQELCDVEKQLAERMAQNHSQLRRDYLRLMQEQ